MARTVRNYEYNNGHDGGKVEKFLREDDGYTGYVGENIWNRNAKKAHKKAVNKHNRAIRNAIIEMEQE